jgi:hypothetical protein
LLDVVAERRGGVEEVLPRPVRVVGGAGDPAVDVQHVRVLPVVEVGDPELGDL